MATPQESKTCDKRGPGRPPKSATPAPKRQKTSHATSTPVVQSHSSQSPAVIDVDSSAPEKRGPRLPAKVSDNKPLPTLSEQQRLALPDNEYQSIAASAVLAASLERSRTRWVCDGVFERYWVKPEGGKNAKNAKLLLPNNPDPKSMKFRGECRIRIEPHLFMAHLFVEEKPKVALPPKQYTANANGQGQQYRPPQQNQPLQSRPPAPLNQQTNGQATNLTPTASASRPPPAPQPVPSRAQPSPTPIPPIQPGQKSSPDPVISMLATRASSDPELKALMKEVATGNATQDQLKIFQKHIDELTVIIQRQKQDEGETALKNQQQSNMIQYDGSSDMKPQLQATQAQQQPRPQVYTAPQPPPPVYGQQQPWAAPTPAPAPAALPVILEFTGPGATEDRFLFPQHSILEALSAQHLLVSFIVTRKGRDAVDGAGLVLDKEYWIPITFMIEVAYGREELLNCVRRWAKPADEVRAHMEDTMKRCQRAPDSHLALRLPFKGAAITEEVSKEATPVVVEEKPKPKTAARLHKKATPVTTPKTVQAEKKQKDTASAASSSKLAATPQPSAHASTAPASDTATAGTPATTESGRPKRSTRKSVRITEG